MEGCVFHNKRWRGEFQRLLNLLRGSLLSEQQLKLFPRAVCPCKGGPSFNCVPLTTLESWLQASTTSTTSGVGVSPEAQLVLSQLIQEGMSPRSPFADSVARTLTVVKSATDGNYAPLTGQASPVKPVKRIPKLNFELPLRSSNLAYFIGRNGAHLKTIAQKYNNNVVIRIGGEGGSRKKRRLVIGDKAIVHLKGVKGKNVDLEQVKSKMLSWAELVTRHREQQKTERSRFSAFAISRGPQQTIATAKQAAVEHFEKKQHHKNDKGSNCEKKKVLSGGHCLHCMGEYQQGATKEGACTFHSGFLISLKYPMDGHRTKWTCCSLQTKELHPTHQAHLTTGCCTGRHVWRTGKSTKGASVLTNKAGSQVVDPDFTL